MKQMLRIMTPTRDVLNDIMILAEKRRTSRWSVPVLHPFPMERSSVMDNNILYMIRNERAASNRPRTIMIDTKKPVITLPHLRLIRSTDKQQHSRWGMYVFPTAEPVVNTRTVLRSIRRKKSHKISSLYAFPSLTTPPKKTHSQLRRIRQSLQDL